MPEITENFLLIGARVSWIKTIDGKRTTLYGTITDYWPMDGLFVINLENPAHAGQQTFKSVGAIKVLEKPELKVAAWETNNVECKFYV
jgi:hypothetical protein